MAAIFFCSRTSSSAFTSRSSCSESWRAMTRARPIQVPTCRATLGSRSGPSTTSAIAEVSRISEKPKSSMRASRVRLGRSLHLGFVGGLRLGARGEVGVLVLLDLLELLLFLALVHGRLEATHRSAEIRADGAQSLGAEDDHGNEQNQNQHPIVEHVGSPKPATGRAMIRPKTL